mgnify:CR=1 FL=1
MTVSELIDHLNRLPLTHKALPVLVACPDAEDGFRAMDWSTHVSVDRASVPPGLALWIFP